VPASGCRHASRGDSRNDAGRLLRVSADGDDDIRKNIERHRALAALVIRGKETVRRMVVVEIEAKVHDLHVIDPPPAHDDADRVLEVCLVALRRRIKIAAVRLCV
jgi:hypothetical protein